MKKNLLLIVFTTFFAARFSAQCVFTCSTYVVNPIAFTTIPTPGSTDVISQFSPNQDDGITPLINIGFNFQYFCTTYTQLWICSNGFIQFNNGVPAISTGYSDPTQAFPNPTAPNAMVALNMNDLDASGGNCSINYVLLGTAPNRMFVVSYVNVPVYGYPSGLHTGQIVLYETSNIIEIYTGSVQNTGTTPGTQGIENANGSSGYTVPGRNDVIWSATSSAYQFAPYSSSPPSAVNGNTLTCSGSGEIYNVTASPGALSYSWTAPSGWTGTSTTNILNVNTGASGNLSVSAIYTCGISGATTLSVNTLPLPVVSMTVANPIICSGEIATITPAGAVSYTLEPGTLPGTTDYLVGPNVNTTYTLYGVDANGCVSNNDPNMMITVNTSPTVSVNSGSVCPGQTFTVVPTGADYYTYSTNFPYITQTAPGNYTFSVVGTATNGCAATVNGYVTVYPNPTVNITAANSRTMICQNESVVLTAHGADSYHWLSSGGGNTATYTVLANSFTATYTVTGTTTNGCSKNSSILIITDPCTGIQELNASAAHFMSAYPNPSSGQIMVQVSKAATVAVYDLQGKLILQQQFEAGEHLVDLRNVNAGQYFLRASSDNASQSLILVKE